MPFRTINRIAHIQDLSLIPSPSLPKEIKPSKRQQQPSHSYSSLLSHIFVSKQTCSLMRTGHDYTELCKNIPDKFRESLSKCSADHLKISVWRNISASDSQNLAGMFFSTYSVEQREKTVKFFDRRRMRRSSLSLSYFEHACRMVSRRPARRSLGKFELWANASIMNKHKSIIQDV